VGTASAPAPPPRGRKYLWPFLSNSCGHRGTAFAVPLVPKKSAELGTSPWVAAFLRKLRGGNPWPVHPIALPRSRECPKTANATPRQLPKSGRTCPSGFRREFVAVENGTRQWSGPPEYLALPPSDNTNPPALTSRDDNTTCTAFSLNQPECVAPGLGIPKFASLLSFQLPGFYPGRKNTAVLAAVNELRWSYGQFNLEFAPTAQTAGEPDL